MDDSNFEHVMVSHSYCCYWRLLISLLYMNELLWCLIFTGLG